MKSRAFVLNSKKIKDFLCLRPNKFKKFILKQRANKLRKVLRDERK